MAGWREAAREAAQRVAERLEEAVGYAAVPADRLELLEAVAADHRAMSRQLDLMGWSVLDGMNGNPHEVKAQSRINAARQARQAWMWDPMAGSAIDLMNDFVFGRGVSAPTAHDDEVQKIIDAAWSDADNVAALTGYSAQLALGTDLSIQSNLFFLFFADGDDGKVKLSLLDHDTVIDAMTDPLNKLRVLYYIAQVREYEWDFATDQLRPVEPMKAMLNGGRNVKYFAHWKNVQDAEQDITDGIRAANTLPKPPAEKMGEGLVFHIAVNRTSEMVFGVSKMQRTLRWFSAYNDLMSARVDMAKASAELIMSRTVKGTPNQMQKLAQQSIAMAGELAGPLPGAGTRLGGLPAGTVQQNENVTHEKFTLDSGAGNAQLDTTMIRSQVAAGTGWPQHYLGDQGSANLATATAMELPVTKMVGSRQELFEQVFRAFTDMVIKRAVETGQIQGVLPGEEGDENNAQVTSRDAVNEAGDAIQRNDGMRLDGSEDVDTTNEPAKGLDLGYDFKMPDAIKRMMMDLANAISVVAKTFDPNNTNIELSRTLLGIALGDVLEQQDVADIVNRIFPPGYQDPLVKVQLDQAKQGIQAGQMQMDGMVPAEQLQQRGGADPNADTSSSEGGPGSGTAGPYGTKSQGTQPEDAQEASAIEEAASIEETRFTDLPGVVQDDSEERVDEMDKLYNEMVGEVARDAARALPAGG